MSGSLSVALTFEAGGDPHIAAEMLNVLRAEDVVATLFVDGGWAAAQFELLKRMVREGHELGNHAYTHANLTRLPDDAIREELARTNALAVEMTGERAWPWHRPPYGALDERVRRIVREAGYRIIQRNALDGGHWPGKTTPERILARSKSVLATDTVLTFHVGSELTLAILPQIIASIRARGGNFVRLSELSDVSEYPPRHPVFAGCVVDPGYLEVRERGAPAWSINLLAYAAHAATALGMPQTVGADDELAFQMISSVETVRLPASAHARYLLIVYGRVACGLRWPDASDDSVFARCHAADLIFCPAGYDLVLNAADDDASPWIALVVGPQPLSN